jgi:hypothetical protein
VGKIDEQDSANSERSEKRDWAKVNKAYKIKFIWQLD